MLALAGEKLRLLNWERDQFPEFLWVLTQLADGAASSVMQVANLLDGLSDYFEEDSARLPKDWYLTGELSSFDDIPEELRDRFVRSLLEINHYEDFVPEALAHVLGLYPSAPGRWLIQPWLDRGLSIDRAKAEAHLSRLLESAADGRSDLASRAKAIFFRQALKAGSIRFEAGSSNDFLEVLPRYPVSTNDEETRMVQSHIRAAFNTLARENSEWPQLFWRSNWALFACEWPASGTFDEGSAEEGRKTLAEFRRQVLDEATALWDRFSGIAGATDPDLMEPDRFEVLTGLVGRVLRQLFALVGDPNQWAMEHGAPVVRSLVEAQIVFEYLLDQEGSGSLYTKFKAYGNGRLKLLKLHLEEYVDAQEDPSSDVLEYLEYLTALVNRETTEEFQEIDVGPNFAGIDMRKMSARVGMETEYRLLFGPASSNLHGEWTAIDDNVFVICLNRTHRHHRIVAERGRQPISAAFVDGILERAETLVDRYEEVIAPKTESSSTA